MRLLSWLPLWSGPPAGDRRVRETAMTVAASLPSRLPKRSPQAEAEWSTNADGDLHLKIDNRLPACFARRFADKT